MKTLLLSFLLACFFITAQAQYSDSSAISPCVYLQYSFEVHFGTIEKVQWHRTINELFRADFTRNGIGYSAYFDSNNEYVSTTRIVGRDDIPTIVFKQVKSKLPGYTIIHVVEFWNEEKHVYYAECSKNSLRKMLSVDASESYDFRELLTGRK